MQIAASDMPGVNAAQAAIAATLSTPFTSSTVRKPKRRSTGVVSGLTARLPANTAMSTSPAVAAQAEGPLEHQGQQERHGGDRRAEQGATRVRDRKVSTFSAPRSSIGRRLSWK